MMSVDKNCSVKKVKVACVFLMFTFVLPLVGCEVTFKTRDYYSSKSTSKQKTTQKSRDSKSFTKTSPNTKNKSKAKPQQNKEASMGSKVLSLLGLKSVFASKTPQTNLKNETNLSSLSWVWPVKSTKDNHISLKKVPEGMVFLGKPTTPVLASAKGVVTYSGNGLKDYGNLIIIKHANDMLSVYANNKKLIAKEGYIVSQGQEIAKMGETGKMHFEIRQNGKTLDPLKVLPNKMK
jgi:murein DD-endopeptidase MepM/ murein hydrolase activator NlpD